jgi:hypothetical protein
VLEELLSGPQVLPQQRYTRLEAQPERQASRLRLKLGDRSRPQGPVSLKLLPQQAMQLAEPVRPASELEVEVWMQSLRSGQRVSVRPAWQVSLLAAVWVPQALVVQVWP